MSLSNSGLMAMAVLVGTAYFNVTGRAGISIEKTASTNGACPGFDPLAVSINDTVTYCFNVTIPGTSR